MFQNFQKLMAVVCLTTLFGGCQQAANLSPQTVAPASMRDVPAQRLGYRLEADILAPPELQTPVAEAEKLTAIQAQFDQNRAQDSLSQTISSPDKQRVLAVYQTVTDKPGEFRLDLYDAGGKLIRKITPEGLALAFPDSIVWSPDNNSFAFAGARRVGVVSNQEIIQEAPSLPQLDGEPTVDSSIAPVASPTAPPTTILTFRTEQIYLANRDGGDLKPLTQTDGLIYYYFTFSPDGAMLAALACRENEWQALEVRAQASGEKFKPLGRPRLLEKNGRERRLDDNLTEVELVWSPDSSKVATAYDKNLRIYDAIGNAPTAAAIPLQVQLQTASQIYEAKMMQETAAANVEANANNANTNVNTNVAAPPPNTELASFLPIVALKWTGDETMFVQTGYVRDFVAGDNIRSFMRWHKLNLSAQTAVLK